MPHIKRITIIAILLLIFIPSLCAISNAWVFKSKGTEKNAAPVNTKQEPIASLQCNQFTFDASSSYDPDNENLKFSWDFGDGETSNKPVVTHIYSKSGLYNVKLSVMDNSGMNCSTAVTTQSLVAHLPPKAIINAKDNICSNQKVIFDATSSYDDSGSDLGYAWDFGDGTSTIEGSSKETKIYAKGGNYRVTLTVDDNSGMNNCSSGTAEKIVHVNEPPTANAGNDIILKCVSNDSDMLINFDASSSSDINNDILSYSWDFGDRESAEGKKVSHQYQELKNYNVKLIVKDGTNLGCGTSVDFITVRFNRAPIANAGDDIISCAEIDINFDGDRSFINKKGTASAVWQFGDGESANGLKAIHSYSKAGQYKASLTLKNNLNKMCAPSRDTRNVTINSSPSVAIRAIDSICLGSSVQFDASSAEDPDGDTLEYYWSFGDGTILKSGPKVTHEYKQGGSYQTTVIVDDAKGTACSTTTASVNIKVNTPPIADAGENLSCCVGKSAPFDASSSTDPDEDILSYTWDFGDGTIKSGESVTHTYTKSGKFNVLMTVNDNSQTSCNSSTAGFLAEVNATPVPIIKIR